MNGVRVGQWQSGKGQDRLQYDDQWINHAQGRPLSLSLPFLPGNLALTGPAVAAWFDNLLPDNEAIRRRLAQRHQSTSSGAFDLLARLGRDCAGAVQLLPLDEAPGELFSITGTPLDEATIAQLLREVPAGVVPGQRSQNHDLRLSVAGAQEKTALLWHQNQWFLPRGTTPTTHLFKLPLGRVGAMQADMRTSVENEWLCAQLAAAYGLPVAQCEMARFEEQKVLIVQRFDRRLASDGTWLLRLPQEDCCQARGVAALHKYQADGGPGIADIMKLLSGSEQAEQDRRDFFQAQILFWLLAATDGHAKNFSIFHLPGGRYRMTPLYDILSAHPVIGSKAYQIAPQKAKLAMAMAVRGSKNHYLIGQIRRPQWLQQARQVGLEPAVAEQLIEQLLQATGAVLARVEAQLPPDFPRDVSDAIFNGIRAQCLLLARS
jgi:serine/threonine-protein kinase HipA